MPRNSTWASRWGEIEPAPPIRATSAPPVSWPCRTAPDAAMPANSSWDYARLLGSRKGVRIAARPCVSGHLAPAIDDIFDRSGLGLS